MNPAQRSKQWLIQNGWLPWRVEHYNTFSRKKTDLYNLFDYVAIWDSRLGIRSDTMGVSGIQVTTDPSLSAHRLKALSIPYLAHWILACNRMEIHSWDKHGPRGKRKTWTLQRWNAVRVASDQITFVKL